MDDIGLEPQNARQTLLENGGVNEDESEMYLRRDNHITVSAGGKVFS
jgi:hypothetical protein